MIKKIIFLFLTWRILIFLPLIFSNALLPPRVGYEYTLLPYFTDSSNYLLSNFSLYPFGNFDGIYYLLIAANGYTVNAGFFPLFPLSINIFTRIFGPNISSFDPRQYIAANFLVNIFLLLSLILIYRLVRLDYKENAAIRTVIFLLIFPTSFFFVGIYSESLFLLLTLLTFYFARKKNWVWAGITGLLLSAARIVGIAMFPTLLYEYFKNEKNKSLFKLLSIFLTPLGLIGYVFYNFMNWGNPFYFIQAQGNFQNNRTVSSIVLLPQTLFRYLKILLTVKPTIYEWWVALFELVFCVFTLAILYIAWKRKVRFSYLLFGLLCLLIPISTGTLSGIPRYVLIIFPIFITLSLIESKLFKIIYIVISVILLFTFFTLFSKGYFIA